VIDSLNTSFKQKKEIWEKEKVIKSKPLKVKVISSCSTKPELCGTMAFSSVSLVQILEGKYIGDSIYVAVSCSNTNYRIGQNYRLTTSYAPRYSVHLCNGKTYNSDWNYKLDENKFLLFFGGLTKDSDFKP